ncbi:MAG: hypothetical protein IJZ29_05370 [Clostridia bacterium]|nr:hypothetical protein [Clostridia bacterium]
MPTYKSKKGVVYNKLSFFKLFGFDHSQIYRYCECYEKFFVSNMCDVAQKMRPVFFAYSPSKLIELLSVSNEQLEKDIASGVLEASMTVKEIRQYVKRLKGETKGNAVYADNNPDVEDEEIPQAFDPTKYYEISYFENQSKQDLINICKIYQNKYVKKVVNDSI